MNRHTFYPPRVSLPRRRASDNAMVYIAPELLERKLATFDFGPGQRGRLLLAAQAGARMLGAACTRWRTGGWLTDAQVAQAIRDAAHGNTSNGNLDTQRRRVRLLRKINLLQQCPHQPTRWHLLGFEHKNFGCQQLARRRQAKLAGQRLARAQQVVSTACRAAKSAPLQQVFAGGLPYKRPLPQPGSVGQVRQAHLNKKKSRPQASPAGAYAVGGRPTTQVGGIRKALGINHQENGPYSDLVCASRVPQKPTCLKTIAEQHLNAIEAEAEQASAKHMLSKCLADGQEKEAGQGLQAHPTPPPAQPRGSPPPGRLQPPAGASSAPAPAPGLSPTPPAHAAPSGASGPVGEGRLAYLAYFRSRGLLD